MRRLAIGTLCACALLAAGCGDAWRGGGGNYIRPTIAVMKFENRASFPLGWDLSGGMRDVLVDRLVATGRFQVIERPELNSILRELSFQQTGATRKQNRAKLGRIKNVQYLIKGTITDFGHVSTTDGAFGLADLDLFGSSAKAVMSMTLYVVDVESGQIICSESLEQTIRAKDVSVKAAYRGVSFGGRVFYKTPLGRATRNVIDKAVRQVGRSVASKLWTPRIAHVRNDGQIILNGGKDRRVRMGGLYEVVQAGEPIIDPETGDTLGEHPGKVLACIRVVSVRQKYSIAETVTGQRTDLKIGQSCRPAEALPELSSKKQ